MKTDEMFEVMKNIQNTKKDIELKEKKLNKRDW